ncbi:hypothetical protein B0E53_00845 [Micromonospora sp. MH33]|uniref:hypothetical protein n=1 Tax=Micromonospora sp. MH33 TaxID=1945509 RepID=UPI000D2E135D|nr:hypothetical protein [Micromonospora sp. MH33]PSK67211.1 hypothetical protein B0E53_00845 [Micromonospora sp. MH33]
MLRSGPSRLLALVATAVTGTSALVAVASPAAAAPLNLTPYVNPFIGTDDSNAPNPVGGGAGGSTVPGPVQPFGMVQLSPDTPTASPSGYRFSDTQIEEFSLTHFNGAGCANNEDLGILPITGAVGASPGTSWTAYRATQDKAQEQARPGWSTWTTVAQVRGNTAGASSHPMSVDGRYLLVKVLTPTQTTDPAARLYEVEVYGT